MFFGLFSLPKKKKQKKGSRSCLLVPMQSLGLLLDIVEEPNQMIPNSKSNDAPKNLCERVKCETINPYQWLK